jgi:1-acyl-sn-glycerol-3-phosphate acyltransferase
MFFLGPVSVLTSVYRPVTKWLLFCLREFVGINYKILNMPKLLDRQVIVGCNHQSTWETFIFSIIFDKLAIVIKEELLKYPIACVYFKRLGCIPINRSSPILSIKTLLKYGKMAHQAGRNILIFPNGTRGDTSTQTEYKSGIYALYKTLGIPVMPAKVNSGEHWSRRSFKKIPGTIVIDFKDPIEPGLSKDDFFHIFEIRMNE